jgi:hypothetical protein
MVNSYRTDWARTSGCLVIKWRLFDGWSMAGFELLEIVKT